MDTENNNSSTDGADETPEEVINPTQTEVTSPALPTRSPGSNIKHSQKLPKPQSKGAYKCPICIKYVRKREPMATLCGHVFCKECITPAVLSVRRCPLCKKRVKLYHLQRIFL